jgi:hypothetical protein
MATATLVRPIEPPVVDAAPVTAAPPTAPTATDLVTDWFALAQTLVGLATTVTAMVADSAARWARTALTELVPPRPC